MRLPPGYALNGIGKMHALPDQERSRVVPIAIVCIVAVLPLDNVLKKDLLSCAFGIPKA
jgi:hypothetical protein